MNENSSKWHQMTPSSVCRQLHTNAACGLSRKAARSRFKKQGRNTLFDDAGKKNTYLNSLLLDPAILLMLFAFLLSLVLLPVLQVVAVAICFLLLIALLIRFLRRAQGFEHTVKEYRTPTVCVLRDGRRLTVSAARVVPGDVLILHRGDILPGDCRLLHADHLRVLTLCPNEEGQPIYREYAKNAEMTYPYGTTVNAPEAENMLYGGSEIISGEAMAVLVAVGESSYLGAIQAFELPSELKEKKAESTFLGTLKPYLRLYGVAMLILMTLITVIGLLAQTYDGGLASYFLSVCVLGGAASPAVLLLYLQALQVGGCCACAENNPPKNRAVIKSAGALERVASITDLFVIGNRGLSDGVTHLVSSLVGETEIHPENTSQSAALQPLCEAMLLLKEADARALISYVTDAQGEHTTVIEELLASSGYDYAAMKLRLKKIEKQTHPSRPELQCVSATLQEDVVNLFFDTGKSLARQCVLYREGATPRAITPAYRTLLQHFFLQAENNGCKTLTVAKECGEGTLAIIGILSVREDISAVLPSVVEELSQCGVTTRFFRSDAEYLHACRLPEPVVTCSTDTPHLTPALLAYGRTFIGFPRTELSALLPQLQKQGKHIAVLCGHAEDRCFLRRGILTFAADAVGDLKAYVEDRIQRDDEHGGEENSMHASQVMRRHADVIIERANRFGGGVYAVLQTLSHSRAVSLRTRMLLRFCMLSQISRATMAVLAACFGLGTLSVIPMMCAGFGIEIASLVLFECAAVPQTDLRAPIDTSNSFWEHSAFASNVWLPTILSAAITTLVCGILMWCKVLTRPESASFLFLSLLLLQVTQLLSIAIKNKLYFTRKNRVFGVLIAAGVLLLLLLLSAWIPAVASVTEMGAWKPLSLALLPCMPVLYLISALLLPFFDRTAK